MYNDDDYTYEDGYYTDGDDEEDEYLFEDGFFSFDDETDELPDIPWDIPRESPPGELIGSAADDFKRDVLDLFLETLINEDAIRNAGPSELLYVFQMYKAFMKKTQTDCPKGLYSMAVTASEIYDELFPHGTF